MAENVKTIGTGGDYATPALWESNEQSITTGDQNVGECLNGSSSWTCTIAGATTSSSTYRILRNDSAGKYDPSGPTGDTWTNSTTSTLITVGENFSRVTDLALIPTAAFGIGTAPFVSLSSDSARAERLYIKCTTGNQGFGDVPKAVQASAKDTQTNDCIFVGSGGTNGLGYGLYASGQQRTECWGNTAYNIDPGGGTAHAFYIALSNGHDAQNNVAIGSRTADFQLSGSGTSYDHNASGDTSATGTGSLTNQTVAGTWTDAANGDFTLVGSSGCVDGGTNVGTGTDYFGDSRDATYDIGALEYVTSAAERPPLPIRVSGALTRVVGALRFWR